MLTFTLAAAALFSDVPLAIGMPNGFEWLIIAAIGLLIFGKRLPEVGRSLGKGIVEFKKGLKGVEDEVSQVDHKIDTDQTAKTALPPTQQSSTTTVAQFDPYTGKPINPTTVPPTNSGTAA
jgi:sec-independent protein translocase protein TatA